MTSAPLLLLFDIDGTLLQRASDDHREALFAALRELYGIEPAGVPLDFGGRTDGEIARHILLDCGVDAKTIDARLEDLRVACCRHYAQRASEDLAHTVTPGMPEVLAALHEREDAVLALLTGNYEPVARLKLRRAGLAGYFAAGQGAFGSDSEDRAALPALARRRAGSPGAPWPPERTVVVGDTPRDIACARADGDRCVGLATGPYPPDALAGADAVVRDAAALGPVLEYMLAAAATGAGQG